MAPTGDEEEDEEDWRCRICGEVLFEPVTMSCCGSSFCQDCLRSWVIQKLSEKSRRINCPYPGCRGVVPRRLPAISKILSSALAKLAPTKLEQRRREEAEAAASAEPILSGFHPWQEIVASHDLLVGTRIVAPFGSSGIVLANSSRVEGRIMVSFDSSESAFFDVTPSEIISQLPDAFGVRIAQRVFAAGDLMVGPRKAVGFGTQGSILRRCAGDERRLCVEFDGGLGIFNVQPFEVSPYRKLVGGFFPAQRVKASRNLVAEDTLLVKSGISGVVKGEYSDTRLTVLFEYREDGSSNALNVIPEEIIAE